MRNRSCTGHEHFPSSLAITITHTHTENSLVLSSSSSEIRVRSSRRDTRADPEKTMTVSRNRIAMQTGKVNSRGKKKKKKKSPKK